MVVEQSKLWSVIVCSELYIFFYSIYFRATFPGKKSVLLHIIIIIFFFFSFIFSWYIVDPPTWKRQWCCTEVPQLAPSELACLLDPVQPCCALFPKELISWGVTSCYSGYLASSSNVLHVAIAHISLQNTALYCSGLSQNTRRDLQQGSQSYFLISSLFVQW